ncbi:MAG: glycosyltransferase, partial [Primorskyibacter sp.]
FATDMELQLFFHAADIAVYPYQKILTSGSLMLALSYGLPAVVPDVAMTAQVVADSPAGRLYRPEDGLHALEKATLGLLDDVLNTPDRKALRHAVRARAKDFPWQPLDAVLLSSPKEPPV